MPFTALCVIPLRADPLLVHRGLLGLNPQRINYLFPDLHSKTFETDAPAGTPCADSLIPIFDQWWLNGSLDVPVTIFVQIARLILGGKSDLDTMGGGPLSFLFIESDGEIEGLDVLKICHNGMARTGFNVITSDYLDVVGDNSIHRQSLLGEVPLPRKCRGCPEATTCSGGDLPHRYRPRTGFDNPSVWCADILKLFGHMRRCLNVAPEETLIRREALSLLREKTLPRGAYDDPNDPRHSSVGRGGQA